MTTPEENERRLGQLVAAFVDEVRRQLEQGSGEVQAIAHIEHGRLTSRCRIQPAYLRPLTDPDQ